MEKRDIELIEEYRASDALLANLYAEHIEFEKVLEKFESKPFLTPDEQVEKARIKKLKLKGRDEIESILQKYREKQRHGAFRS